MKTNEVLTKTGIKKALLYKYLSEFDFNLSRDEKGQYYFSESDLKKLEQIISLREHHGIITIRKKLGIYNPDISQNTKDINSSQAEYIQDIETGLTKQLESFENSINDKFNQVISLASEYSKVMYKLGKLETENQRLTDKITDLQTGHNKDINGLQGTIEKLKAELNQERIKNEALEAEKKKSWYQKIFKKDG